LKLNTTKLKNKGYAAVFATMLIAGNAGWASTTISMTGPGNAVAVSSNSNNLIIVNDQIVSGGAKVIVGKGPGTTENRAISGFTSVNILAPVEMTYSVSPTRSLSVTAPANILPLITTTVKNGQLNIGLKGAVELTQPIAIVASGSTLGQVNLGGAGFLHVSGLNGPDFRVEETGSGEITAAGQVQKVDVSMSGSGDVNLSALHAKQVDVSVSGVGNVIAYASQRAHVDVSGVGSVQIHGHPTNQNVDQIGLGLVTFP
jgi:hypothetical protein